MFSSFLNFILYHTPIFYLIQSVWRDEAFSYFMAKPNVFKIVTNTASDFNPPLYYILLHFWMKIVGRSDEALRLLSFFPHLGTVYVSYLLARRLTSKKFAYFVAVFTFLNPMLLYYAFEMRMYSFYAFFTICSLYFLYIKNWKWYTIVSVLGLYTHSFFSLIIFSYICFLFFMKSPRAEPVVSSGYGGFHPPKQKERPHSSTGKTRGFLRRWINQLQKKNFVLIVKPVLFYLPWIPVLISQFIRSKGSWMFPVDPQLVKSVLGNIFTNYEGTPGGWWSYTGILSVIIVLFLLITYIKKRKQALLLLPPIFIPLFLILAYSMLVHPIYVNRYMIFVVVFEIIGVVLGIWSVKNKLLRIVFSTFWLAIIVYFNLSIPPFLKKTDFKTTFSEINNIANKNDFVYSQTPIGFLESAYYYKYPRNTFIYNPDNISIPNYIGVTVTFQNISKTSWPAAPSKTFLVYDDASYEIVIKR